jgi:glycosyltransferase involved in cell wall biosynthesis
MITTRVGGIPEIYGPLAGSLVAPGNVPALVQAIKGAIDAPPATRKLSQRLRARVAASFSVDAMVEGVLSCYEQAVEAAPLLTQVIGA